MRKTLTAVALFTALLLSAIFGYLVNRSDANLAEPVFLASITVLVFLLPAAGIVGPYLVEESKTAVQLSGQPEAKTESVRAGIVGSMHRILLSANLMRVGFPCTLAAVLLSSIAMAETHAVIKLCSPRVELIVDRVLAGVALGLLATAALVIFPMTWHLLQLKAVQSIYEQYLKPPS